MSAWEIVKNVENSSTSFGRRVARGRTAALGALLAGGVAAIAGCGAVAGPEYTGEVGLELRGEVVSLDEGQDDLVPALAFLTQDAVHLLDGEVTGEFPRQFSLRIDQAPPEDALLSRSLDGSPLEPGAPERVAVAFLVMVTKDHAMTLPFDALSPGTSDTQLSEPDPETGVSTRTETECSADGKRCETRVYACQSEPCDVLLEQERPSSDATVGTNGLSCQARSCLTHALSCDEQSCSRTIAHCQSESPADLIFSDGTIERCTLESRSGLVPGDGRLGSNFAQDLIVMFVSESVDADGIHFEKGYNVLRAVEPGDKQMWAEALACRLDAEAEVMKDPGDDTEEELDARVQENQEKCPQIARFERLDNPGEHELKLSLGAPGSLF